MNDKGKSGSNCMEPLYFLGFRKPFLEDWATLFQRQAEKKIELDIMQRFPILEVAQANALLETGKVVGSVVLQAPERLAIIP